MYTTYFGLTEKPFSLTPDPRFLYLSERHAEALAHLQYGILEGGGFIQLTGEVGTGKTTLTRTLLARLPEEIDLALILNPRLNVRELLITICEELGVKRCADAPDNKTLIDRLNARLIDAHKRGHRAVLIIDEAQNLDIDVLEQLRLLTNLETETAKLLQIILIGQPELRTTLARTDLRQLAQRITGRYHLAGLDVDDTAAYVRHRLAVAGATREIFTHRALLEVHRLAGGTPRLINVICDRALLGAYTAEQPQVTPKLVREAASEVGGGLPPPPAWRSRTTLAGAVLAAVALLLGIGWWRLADPLVDATAPAGTLPAATVGAVVPAATAAGTARAEAPPSTPSLQSALPAPAPAPVIGEWLRGMAADTGTDAALATLLDLWQLAPPAGTQPCRYVVAQGLRCEHQLGSWTLLRAFNRPAILDLIDSTGSSHQVVLTALDDEHATVRAGSQSRVVALAEIDRYWFGEFLLLWQPHPSAGTLMLPGMRSEGVRWLRGALVGLQGGSDPGGDPARYDDALAERVRTFQRGQGLKADGKAGLHTLIALSTVLNQTGTPLLRHGGG
jgi:general secretion pathway protein A